jgi:hypothetical protein
LSSIDCCFHSLNAILETDIIVVSEQLVKLSKNDTEISACAGPYQTVFDGKRKLQLDKAGAPAIPKAQPKSC